MLLALSSACVFTACNDDDVEYVSEHENSLPVVSRETSFPANASQGSIVVDASGPLTVTKDAGEWLTTTIDGNKVLIDVEFNAALDGRTAMLNISDGSRSTNVAVIQAGCIIDLGGLTSLTRNDNAVTLSYTFKENCGVVFSSDADWIHTEVADDKLTVKLDANATGMVRNGNIVWTAGTLQGTIPVSQADFAKDIAGDYYMYYTDQNKKAKYTKAVVKKSGTKYYIDMLNLSYPITYNDSERALVYRGAQYVNTFTYQGETTYVYTIAGASDGYITWSNVGMTATPTLETINDNQTQVFRFMDDGSWGSHPTNAIQLELFKAKSCTSDNRLKVRLNDVMSDPYLVKIVSTSNAPQMVEQAVSSVETATAPAI